MAKHRALRVLSGVISAIAFVFATLLLFVPIGEFGSVSTPAEYRGSVYDLMGHVTFLRDSQKEIESRRSLVVFLYFLFATGLIYSLIGVFRESRISSTSGLSGQSRSFDSQRVSKTSVDNFKRCLFCAEEIQSSAVFCKHCKRDQVT